MGYRFEPEECICGLSLSGKTPGDVREENDGLIGLCPVCSREIPVSAPGEPDPEPDPDPDPDPSE